VSKSSVALLATLAVPVIAGCGSSSTKTNTQAAASPVTTTTTATTSAASAKPATAATKTAITTAKTSAAAAKTSAAAAKPPSTPAAKPPSGPTVKVSSATVSSLGPALVNAQGHTLYIFEPDRATKVTCVGSCAAVWPPVKLEGSAQPAAAGAVKASLLGSAPDPEGGRVITYHGWPLYTYVADSGPGTATGQALNLNGGLWYVIAPSGEVHK
jgi:predicted lipoprotein with Yx(FWY)xxD motif